MKERPILFTGEMVHAILDGRKTQTRRPVKPQPIPFGEDSPFTQATLKEHVGKPWMPVGGVFPDAWQKPFGTIGDRLWVRETWRVDGIARGMALRFGDSKTTREGMSYRVDMEGDIACDDCDWMPSAWMPRWASRIDLEITAVRVERVQDITEEDATREGIVESEIGRLASRTLANYKSTQRAPVVLQFADLWQSIYGNWDANPWVWVYEFRRIKP